ncbi:GNAT family N-acetyltransferase [Macrococcoides caseolyticum]|uniref:GNAT family N-acetyltransferase n=1 Tax=Macrococcoides caseolyticum TaxID=69966 RepID=UPI000C33A5B6|nr:GNAT family N-acetyltransferase [Macrococcus caseolyticus]PKE31394.1 GNAT family N-acetyltransferase [Macrococcus caseolyticus]PKF29119.1 GNAT family N-acetyltransferase [Macrococcus caseolyticus]
MIEFRKLTIKDKIAFEEYMREWNNPEEIVPTATNYSRYSSFEDMIEKLDMRESGQDWVNNTTFFYFIDGVIIGAANIRHKLTKDLLNTGGHIGYGLARSYRGQGYATKILQESLVFARSIGIEKALITCDEDNIASSRVIIKNGGLEDKPYLQSDGIKSRRFWINI